MDFILPILLSSTIHFHFDTNQLEIPADLQSTKIVQLYTNIQLQTPYLGFMRIARRMHRHHHRHLIWAKSHKKVHNSGERRDHKYHKNDKCSPLDFDCHVINVFFPQEDCKFLDIGCDIGNLIPF